MKKSGRSSEALVEEALAADGTAETGDTIGRVHFALELIIVGEFLV